MSKKEPPLGGSRVDLLLTLIVPSCQSAPHLGSAQSGEDTARASCIGEVGEHLLHRTESGFFAKAYETRAAFGK